MTERPTAALARVARASHLVAKTADGLTEAQARGASRLPGWTRGHVLTHLARNADGNRNMVEGTLVGEEWAQYPGGAAGRASDIEAGAGRGADALLADLLASHEALVAAWARVPDDGWARVGLSFAAGSRPITDGVVSRERELLVHLVDLDLGVTPSNLPHDFVAEQGEWLREFRTRETWPDAPW